MKQFILFAITLIYSTALLAQTRPALFGKVVNAEGGNIEYANVVVTDEHNLTIASTSVSNGNFTINTIAQGQYTVTIMLVGYQPYVSEPTTLGETPIDLGTIVMQEVENGLEVITVTAEKNRVVYKLDRKKIDASSILSASGGTAIDVLSTTPSIRIDANGGVSFRGSTNFLVYVDGKPSALEGTQALAQIPAASIADIEIITTPSARYKTDGDVGIINIVTKRNDTQGLSGFINSSASSIGAWNTDIMLSYKHNAHRWYIGGNAIEDRGRSDFKQTKETIVDDFQTTSIADGVRNRNNASYIGTLGWGLSLDKHHLQLEFQSGMTKTARGGDMLYDEHRMQGSTVINDNTYDSHDRYSNEKNLAQISTDYTWKVNERGDVLSLAGRFRYDWYALEYTESNMFELSGVRYEGTRGYESEHHWDIDATMNYTLNYAPSGKADIGYQFTSYSEHGDYNIKYWDRQLKDFVWQDDLYAPFFYRRQIHSTYVMLNQTLGNLEIDAGVRADHTIDKMTIAVEGASRYIKRTELFPSAHIAYNQGDNTYTMGYSYRTNRPGIWQLEPYITYEDYYTKMTGNPDIKPEYIHSAEIGYRRRIADKHSLALTAFYRHRSGVRERVRVAYEPGVTLDSLINAGNDRNWGIEANANIKASSWWTMAISGSVFDYKFTANYKNCSDNANVGYMASMINNFSLGNTTSMQVDANVIGPTVLTQGREEAYCYFDIALRQLLFKKRVSLSLVAHDILRTAKYTNFRISPTLNSTTYVKPKYPNIVLSIGYAFNTNQKTHTGAATKGAIFDGKDF